MTIHTIGLKLALRRDQIEEVMTNIVEAMPGGARDPHSRTPFRRADPLGDFLILLGWCGYQAVYDSCDDLVRFTGVDEQLDIEEDLVLPALVGVVPAGSYLTFFAAEYGFRQVRYSEAEKWTVQGFPHFPQNEHWDFPTEVNEGLLMISESAQ